MNIESLKTFIAVAEQKNFTKAAQYLIVVQSTVTNRIKELENEVGQQLLIRSNKTVDLTPAGKRLLSYAYRFVDMENTLLSEINSIERFRDILNIGSVNCVYCCHLRPYISRILKEHPDIQLNVTLIHSRDLIMGLGNDVLDIAFSYVPINDEGFICSVFRQDEILLLTSPKNDTYPSGIHNDQLIHLPIIYSKFAPKVGFDWISSVFPKNHSFPMTLNVMEKIVPYLLEGNHYAFLPRSLVQEYLDSGALCSIDLLDFDIPKMPVYMITKKKSGKHPEQYFLD